MPISPRMTMSASFDYCRVASRLPRRGIRFSLIAGWSVKSAVGSIERQRNDAQYRRRRRVRSRSMAAPPWGEVRHHLHGDLAWIGGNALCGHAVIAGEDQNFGAVETWRRVALPMGEGSGQLPQAGGGSSAAWSACPRAAPPRWLRRDARRADRGRRRATRQTRRRGGMGVPLRFSSRPGMARRRRRNCPFARAWMS